LLGQDIPYYRGNPRLKIVIFIENKKSPKTKAMKLEYLIVLSLCMVSVSCHQLPSSKKISHKPLRFCGDGSFKIVQFTDTHWKNGDPNDWQTTALMASILDLEKPDLVVLTGDVLAGKDCEDSLASLARCVTPMIEREIPWAMAFGNHDDEGSASRAELMIFQRSLPFCLWGWPVSE